MSLLALTAVSKRFGGITAVSDVTFEVAPGEILGLMGANGAGKTTLFALIAGNLSPSTGTIALDGRRIDGLPSHRVNRLGIARTFQIVRPFAGMTVLENVAIAAMYGAGRKRRAAAAAEAAHVVLDEVGLGRRAATLAGALTLAERKRLEVARALATEPRILLLDEVLAGLTATEVTEALDIITALRQRRRLTLVVVEHVMKALMRLSDRIVVLHHGEKLAEGTPEAVANDPRVQATYFGVGQEEHGSGSGRRP